MAENLVDEQGNQVTTPEGVDPEQLIQGAGRVAMVRPDGTGVTIPVTSLHQAIEMGYRPESQEAHQERQLEQEYGDRPITAALEGAASGATFGLSDLVGAQIDPEHVREIRKRNAVAAGVGSLAGSVASMAALGVGGAVAEAAGGGAAAGVLGSTAEGGLIGLGQGASQVALSKDPMNAQAVAGALLKNVLLGGAAGAAGGALGQVVSRAASKAKEGLDTLSDSLAESAATTESRADLELAQKAETDRLAAAAEKARPELVGDLRALRADQKPFREALATRLSSAPDDVRADLIRSERSLAGIVGNPRQLTAAPESALDAITAYKQSLQAALGTDPPQLAQGMLDRVSGIEDRLEKLAAGSTSPALEDIQGKLAAATAAEETGKKAVTTAAEAGIHAVAHGATTALGLPGLGFMAHLFAGKLAGKVGDALGGQIATRAAEVGSRIAAAASSVAGGLEAGSAAAFTRATALAPSAFDSVRQSVLEAASDPQGTRARIDAELAGVRLRDPVLAQQIGDIHAAAVQHLAQVAPRAPGGPTLTDQSGPVSRMAQDQFMRRVEVALDPTMIADHLAAGTLTPSMVETGDAVYGPLMGTMRDRLMQSMSLGAQPNTARRLALSILLGAPATGSMQPAHIAAAQQRMATEMNNAARPPQPGGMPKPEEPTGSQRFTGR